MSWRHEAIFAFFIEGGKLSVGHTAVYTTPAKHLEEMRNCFSDFHFTQLTRKMNPRLQTLVPLTTVYHYLTDFLYD